MSTVLDEVTSETISAAHVRQRVEDWEGRLQGLYAAIGNWLPDGWKARQGPPIMMHEELMRKYGIAAKRIPTLELLRRSGEIVKIEPRALWIIGANGRVDLKRDGHRYLIVDMAENFEQPNWQVSHAERRCDRETVTREWLGRVLQ